MKNVGHDGGCKKLQLQNLFQSPLSKREKQSGKNRAEAFPIKSDRPQRDLLCCRLYVLLHMPFAVILREARSLTRKPYDDSIIDHQLVWRFGMATTTISPKFQIVIPKDVREKLHLSPQQRLQVVERGGVITLVPEVPLKNLKGALKGMSKKDIREKKDRL